MNTMNKTHLVRNLSARSTSSVSSLSSLSSISYTSVPPFDNPPFDNPPFDNQSSFEQIEENDKINNNKINAINEITDDMASMSFSSNEELSDLDDCGLNMSSDDSPHCTPQSTPMPPAGYQYQSQPQLQQQQQQQQQQLQKPYTAAPQRTPNMVTQLVTNGQ